MNYRYSLRNNPEEMQFSSCCALITNFGPYNTEYSFADDILAEKNFLLSIRAIGSSP
jgi:hypothetical protein